MSSKVVYLTVRVPGLLYVRIAERARLANRTVEEEVAAILADAFAEDTPTPATQSSNRK